MLLLDANHPLSVKFQNASFNVKDRFDWQSPNGLVPALSIVSVWAEFKKSTFFSNQLGFDVCQNIVIHAETFEVLSPHK